MNNVDRVINGIQATFTDGGVVTTIEATSTGQRWPTDKVCILTSADHIMLPIYAGTQVQRELRELVDGRITSVFLLNPALRKQKSPVDREVVKFSAPEHAFKAAREYFIQPTEILPQALFGAPIALTDVLAREIDDVCRQAQIGLEETFGWRWITRSLGFTSLLGLYGLNRAHLGAVRDAVTKIYQGRVAKFGTGDSAIWHHFFGGVTGEAWLKDLSSRTGEMMLADKKQHCIRIYGTSTEANQQMIAAELNNKYRYHAVKQTYCATFTSGQSAYDSRPGGKPLLWLLQRMLGPANAVYNTSTKALTLLSTPFNAESLPSIFQLPNFVLDTSASPSAQDCPICGSPTTEIRLSCNHTYCTDCFIHQVSSARDDQTATTHFPLRCWAKGCEKPVSLQDLQTHLPWHTLNALLATSLKVYIRTHPVNYRACPRPDCANIFPLPSRSPTSTTPTPDIHTCPTCYYTHCPSCSRYPHPSRTCAEESMRRAALLAVPTTSFYATTSGDEIEMKECPVCAALVEKVAGCWHISCLCGAVWCWVCRMGFRRKGMRDEDCYKHLRRVHGGIGGEVRG